MRNTTLSNEQKESLIEKKYKLLWWVMFLLAGLTAGFWGYFRFNRNLAQYRCGINKEN
jgi:hypothetical protein